MSSQWEFNIVFEGYILIDPRAKGRPRFTRRGFAYTPKETKDYENVLRAELLKQWGRDPIEKGVPLKIECVFHIEKPKSSKREYPTVKPDGDNLLKSILDAANGVLFNDDAQVVKMVIEKNYSTEGFIELRISRLDEIRKPL